MIALIMSAACTAAPSGASGIASAVWFWDTDDGSDLCSRQTVELHIVSNFSFYDPFKAATNK